MVRTCALGGVNSKTVRSYERTWWKLVENEQAASSDEGGVAAGYAVLDSPYLV